MSFMHFVVNRNYFFCEISIDFICIHHFSKFHPWGGLKCRVEEFVDVKLMPVLQSCFVLYLWTVSARVLKGLGL